MNLAQIFEQQFHSPPTLGARAPGRVNLLGEHVDYNDGMVLPAAIDRAVYLVASPSGDGAVHLYAADLGKKSSFRLEDLPSQRDGLPKWARYPAGVAWALQQARKAVQGLNVVYRSDVPMGAGLSSSAAVEVCFAAAWRLAGGWQADGMELAQLCLKAETQYVGLNCGLMDQFASACGVKDHLLYLDTRSLEWYPLPLPPGAAIVIADSGVRRSLTNSAYNERHAECEQAVALLKQKKPGLQSLRDITSVELAAFEGFFPPVIYKRAEHVVKEIMRVEQAVRALNKGDAKLFGGMMYSGHNSLRYLYEVSIPELDILVEATRHIPGCYGARLTGAGFGGCTVNLVEEAQSASFIQALGEEYTAKTGKAAKIYLCHASAGASAENL